MKQLIIIASLLALSGCSMFVPVKRTFPEVPKELTTRCADLKLIPETDKLSEVISVVADNYALYKECQLNVDSWNEWYTTQKKNFESVD